MRQLKIGQKRSLIGQNESNRLTIKGLGLGRIGRVVVKADTSVIRGMVTKVQHLVDVEVLKS